MILENNTSIPIECVAINGGKTVIPPKNKVHIAVDSGNDLLKINHLYGSGRKALFDFDNVYHVVINSEIAVRGADDDAVIVVSGELVHFDLEFVYDKFFFHTQNCTIFLENISVSNLCALQQKAYEPKKKDSHGDRIWTFLLTGGFWSSTGLFVLFKLTFWAKGWPFPWWLIMLFWMLGYAFLILGEKTVYRYRLKKQPKLTELNQYCSTEYIKGYFYNPKREWIADDRVEL